MEGRNSEVRKLTNISLRYVFILLLGLGNLSIFYKVFTPLTMKTLIFFQTSIKDVLIEKNLLFFPNFTVAIIPACVAGAAYYLLVILVFSTPEIRGDKRIKLLFISFAAFFILNLVRINFLIFLIEKPYFNEVHWILWNVVSTVFVVGIWIFLVKKYEIKNIPLYSDFKFVMSLISHPRKASSNKVRNFRNKAKTYEKND